MIELTVRIHEINGGVMSIHRLPSKEELPTEQETEVAERISASLQAALNHEAELMGESGWANSVEGPLVSEDYVEQRKEEYNNRLKEEL